MPLRDHFHPPLSDLTTWDGLHGAWPTLIALDLNKRLSSSYVASPRIHLGAAFEIDVATAERGENAQDQDAKSGPGSFGPALGDGGTATAVWAPPKPTLVVEADLPEQDEYEVQVFEIRRRRLVAAVEIVSPANKDRPESRRVFAAKCAALLQQGVSVSIVDVVTTRRSSLYVELLDLLGLADPSLAPAAPPLYAVTCRWDRPGPAAAAPWCLETWAHALALREPLPTLPLWLAADLAVPLALESTYEETCRGLRIG